MFDDLLFAPDNLSFLGGLFFHSLTFCFLCLCCFFCHFFCLCHSFCLCSFFCLCCFCQFFSFCRLFFSGLQAGSARLKIGLHTLVQFPRGIQGLSHLLHCRVLLPLLTFAYRELLFRLHQLVCCGQLFGRELWWKKVWLEFGSWICRLPLRSRTACGRR